MTLLDFLPSLRRAATPRIDPAIWPSTTTVDDLGRLSVGDVALTEIVDEFRTPTYVLDESDFRHRIRRYRSALRDVEIVYAAKALLTTDVARWTVAEGAGIGVSSGGELTIALGAGVDPARIVMHGNAKTADALRDAAAVGVGRVVIDSLMEIAYLTCEVRRTQRVLIGLTPDIDTYNREAVKRVLHQPLLQLVGLHCHIGTQITDASRYGTAVHRMIATMADIRSEHGIVLTELNIGGGHGVPYVTGDAELDARELGEVLENAIDGACAAERFPRPRLVVEPGRAISARNTLLR